MSRWTGGAISLCACTLTAQTYSGAFNRHEAQISITPRCTTETSLVTTTTTQSVTGTQGTLPIPDAVANCSWAKLNGTFTWNVPAVKLIGTATGDFAILRPDQLITLGSDVKGTGQLLVSLPSGRNANFEANAAILGAYTSVTSVPGCATRSGIDRKPLNQPGSVTLAGSARCTGIDRLRIVASSRKTENGRLTEFQAYVDTLGTMSVVDTIGLNFRSMTYSIRIRSYWDFRAGTDDGLIVTETVPKDRVDPGGATDFRVRVRHILGSTSKARLFLRAYLQKTDASPYRSSTPTAIEGSGEVNLALRVDVPLEAKKFYLKASMIDDFDNLLKETEWIEYDAIVDLSIDHIEIVQTVQTPDNKVPLIAGKPTAVRVFTQIPAGTSTFTGGTEVFLRGFRDGKELNDSPQRITGNSPKVVNRALVPFSHQFRLPPEWIGGGTITLRATVNEGQALNEPNYANNTYPPLDQDPVAVDFQESAVLRVGYVEVCLQTELGSEPRCPSAAVANHASQMRRLFPIDPAKLSYTRFNVPRPVKPAAMVTAWSDDLISWMRKYDHMRAGSGLVPPVDQLVFWLPSKGAGTRVGLSDPKSHVTYGEARVLWVVDDSVLEGVDANYENPLYTTINALPHEIGHNYGLLHTNLADSCKAWDPFTNWPYTTSEVDELGISIGERFAPMAARPNSPKTTTKDFMTYCQKNLWISKFHYMKLLEALPRAAKPQEQRAAGARTETASEDLLISGSIKPDGTARLDPAYRLPAGVRSQSTTDGSYCVAQLDGSGAESARTCFPLSFTDPEHDGEIPSRSFSLRMPFDAGTARVALLKGGQEIASVSSSATAPEIRMVSPQPADVWTSGEKTIVWTAEDADGDPLMFALLYSSDGGASWLPLEVDLKATEFTVNPATLAGSSDVRFRVLATDGFRSSVVDAGPIEIRQEPKLEAGAAVDFYNVLLGESVIRDIVVRNTGSGPLAVQSVEAPDGYRLAAPLPITIAAGAEVRVPVEFLPREAKSYTGRISFTSSDLKADVDIAGKGVLTFVPEMSVSATSLDFGNVKTGETASRAVNILNRGPAPLNVQSVVASSGFTRLGASNTAVVVEAGRSIEITVQFRPAAGGAVTGTLTINSDDPHSPAYRLALRGTGVISGPDIAATPTSLDFGTVASGQSKSLTLTLNNRGSDPLEITSTTLSGTAFTVTPRAPFTVDPQGQRTLTVTFTGSGSGAVTGTLAIGSNDPDTPRLDVALKATLPPAAVPNIAASASTLDFGNVLIGQSKTLTVTIFNRGNGVLEVQGRGIGDSAVFSFTGDWPHFTPPGGQFTQTVRFTPNGTGTRTGEFYLISNDPDTSELEISLRGVGVR